MPKYLYIFGGFFLTPNILEKIVKNISNDNSSDNDIFDSLNKYKKYTKIRNIAILTLLTSGLIFFISVCLDELMIRPNNQFLKWLVKLEKGGFSIVNFGGGFLMVSSVIIVVIVAIIASPFCKEEKRIKNYINYKCDEKLKARDILASNQID